MEELILPFVKEIGPIGIFAILVIKVLQDKKAMSNGNSPAILINKIVDLKDALKDGMREKHEDHKEINQSLNDLAKHQASTAACIENTIKILQRVDARVDKCMSIRDLMDRQST